MKICKKCKKQVANRSKVCRYCGADVTKCKILKQENDYSIARKDKKIDQVVIAHEEKIESNIEQAKIHKPNKKIKILSIKEIINKKNKERKAFNKKVKTVKEIKEHKRKEIIKLIFALVMIILIVFLIVKGTQKLFNISGVVEVKENSSTKVFDMNQKIKYKDVIYAVTDVYVSEGTEYKKPKEGNQFIVVTVDFENNSKDKIRYSYKDWKMSDSEGNFKNRIFSPINVNTALYSGNLVVGAKKSGSMVFEEPIDDEGLLLNYYEYKEVDSEKEENELLTEEKEEPSPIFSIKIKIKKDELIKK